MSRTCSECRNLNISCLKEGQFLCDKTGNMKFANSDEAESCRHFWSRPFYDSSISNQAKKTSENYLEEHKDRTYSGCYISTAVVSLLNLSDSYTEELNVLRKFRSEVLSKDPVYKELLLDYDFYGPEIVNELYACEENRRYEVAIDVFQTIRKCVRAIKERNYSLAVQEYKEMTETLIDEFCRGIDIPDEIRKNYDQSTGGHGYLKPAKAK